VSEAAVLFGLDEHIATITLNRPAKLNAIDHEMLELLDAYCRQIDQSPDARVVLLTGAGDRAFCVGADINDWSALRPMDMWRVWIREGHRVFERLARLPQPVIAVLNGYTFGGGLELALAADLRVAAEQVELAMPECGIGAVPGWGGTQRLPNLIGPARAKQIIFSGARIDAATAERWGLVNEVAPRAALMERALELAGAIAGRAPLSIQMAKQLIDGGLGAATSATLEALAGALAATTEDGVEGVASFRERRAPRFKGK